ncbi:MAG: hypothetical protein ACRDNW_25240 [Trebonia sp.]
MYIEQYLVRQRQQEQIRRAEEVQVSHKLAQVRRLRKRRERAERQLVQAWRRVEQVQSLMSAN